MSDTTPTPDESAQTPEAAPVEPKDDTDWKAEARKWEQRAKENNTKARELQLLQQSKMSEAERAVAEAESKGFAAARTEFGQRLARTEFDAIAGRRNPDVNTAQVLEYVDLSKFVGDDGEPNGKAIAAAVERLVPAPAGGTPNFDGGTRTAAPAPAGMNQLIRKAAGRA